MTEVATEEIPVKWDVFVTPGIGWLSLLVDASSLPRIICC